MITLKSELDNLFSNIKKRSKSILDVNANCGYIRKNQLQNPDFA